ncbi:MAG: copper chaperone PCu(A)C [Alphaproteobacteria bacterium]|nr:copper chaperone PCu(A)C [Alphaproteobacteria bacterium]
MQKLIQGIGYAALTLCLLSACKEKQADQESKASHSEAAVATPADAQKAPAGSHADAGKVVHVKIEGASIPATSSDSAAAYFTIKNDGAEDKLLGANAEGIKTCELHETKTEAGVAKMSAVKEVAVPSGKSVAFAQGGLHVMLIGLPHGGLTEGTKVKLTLNFDKAGPVVAEVPVVAGHASAAHEAKS